MRVVFVGRPRALWRLALLYIVTFGISRRVWLYKVNKEVDGHAALGLDHRLTVFLLCLPVIGPWIVTGQTAFRFNTYLETEMRLPYGPTWALSLTPLAFLIPGNLFFMLWSQDRLNRYWAHEKGNPRHAIDITQGLDKDTQFQKDVQKALEASRKAGSRSDSKWEKRKERLLATGATLGSIHEERQRVRAAGGSTPLLPWKRPKRPARHRLHVVCGQCELAFDAEQDPFAETPILCPRCGMKEILPSLRGDDLARPEQVVVASLQVDCPKCQTRFHTLRDLHGPTAIACYNCGHKGSVPAPAKVATKTA